MTKVKVIVYGRRQQRRRWGYDNSSPDFRHSELKSDDTEIVNLKNLPIDQTSQGKVALGSWRRI